MSSKIVNEPIDKLLGLLFPMTNSQFGYFNPSLLTKDQVSANIKNLILTRKGERVMRPGLGTDLYDLVFEKLTGPDIEERVNIYIRDEIKKWLPYVAIIEISVRSVGTNSAAIKLKYKIYDQIYEELEFSLIGEESIARGV